MKIFYLNREQWVPRPLDEVFSFFADPGNLQNITPPWLSFEILPGENHEMREGVFIDYRLRVHGFPVTWRSEITAWDPPHRFVDEQRRGPYRMWCHEHLFEDQGDRTLVGDRVRYAVPGGLLINRLFVARDVERIFDYRRERLFVLFPQKQV